MNDDNEILSIDANEDLLDYISLDKQLQNDTERIKNKTVSEFEEMGDKYLKEIEIKKKKKELKQVKLVPYILKHEGDVYSSEELMSYSFEDILNMYKELKSKNKPLIVKFFHFMFNIE